MALTGTVLALRALGLGDALTGIPALRGLRRAFPEARLVLAAPTAIGSWLRGLDVVDDVVSTSGLGGLDWAGPAPDVAVNLHGSGPESHRLLQRASPARLVAFAAPEAGHTQGPRWQDQTHEVLRWCTLVRSVGGPCDLADLRLPPVPRRHHVVLHPGAASGSRRWPAERWALVAAGLAAEGHEVVVTGTREEREVCAQVAGAGAGVVDTCGWYGLDDLSELIGSAALLVSGDTGVAHLATAHATPSVLLFGPSSPFQWGPRIDLERHEVLWPARSDDPPGDPHGAELDLRLDRIRVEKVLAAARRLLARFSPPRARHP